MTDPDINVTIAPPAQLTIGFASGGQGVAGPRGDAGPVGPTGPNGPMGTTYTFTQASPASLWTVVHNLNRFPDVTVIDSTGSEVEGDVRYLDANHLTVAFSAPFSGEAYLN